MARPGGERVGQSDLFAEPDEGRGIGHAEFGEAAGDLDGFPGRVVKIGSGPVVLLADVVSVVPVHDVVAIFGRVFGFEPVEFGEGDIEVVERTKRGFAGPRFGGGSANGIDDQADGDMDLLLDFAREVVANGGDPSLRSRGRRRASCLQ